MLQILTCVKCWSGKSVPDSGCLSVQVNAIEFNAAGGASGEANNEAVAALAGVRPGHLLLAEWANSVGRPCHYLAADLATRTLVLAIRCAAVP